MRWIAETVKITMAPISEVPEDKADVTVVSANVDKPPLDEDAFDRLLEFRACVSLAVASAGAACAEVRRQGQCESRGSDAAGLYRYLWHCMESCKAKRFPGASFIVEEAENVTDGEVGEGVGHGFFLILVFVPSESLIRRSYSFPLYHLCFTRPVSPCMSHV